MKQKTLFIAAAVVLLIAFVVGALVYNSEQADQATQNAVQNQAALQRFGAPTLGNPDAKVHIVEFFDPACETCASFYPLVKKLMAANPDRIKLTVRYAPLHQGSYDVVKALEAARRQGKFWEALESLFGAQSMWVINHQASLERAWPALARAGVNVEQAKKDMNAPEIAGVIDQDIADGRSLNVTKTPEYFVNAKPLPSFGWEQLQGLVNSELKRSSR